MPRTPASTDVFHAVAEPRRRELLGLLSSGERPVTALVRELGWPQAQVSKHLGVLRGAGLVCVRPEGRQRFYHVQPEPLKAMHEWTAMFERHWTRQVDRIKARAESAASNPTKEIR